MYRHMCRGDRARFPREYHVPVVALHLHLLGKIIPRNLLAVERDRLCMCSEMEPMERYGKWLTSASWI
jgi:hypothetical protein